MPIYSVEGRVPVRPTRAEAGLLVGLQCNRGGMLLPGGATAAVPHEEVLGYGGGSDWGPLSRSPAAGLLYPFKSEHRRRCTFRRPPGLPPYSRDGRWDKSLKRVEQVQNRCGLGGTAQGDAPMGQQQ
ncbi:hypothetical protein H8959_013274, partial [Pygathrix nigripes]